MSGFGWKGDRRLLLGYKVLGSELYDLGSVIAEDGKNHAAGLGNED